MNTLIIDDEPAANTELKKMLRAYHQELTVVGEATNVHEGLMKIRKLKPELLFLDIEMPGGTGFDLIRQLGKDARPEIVFVTSRNEFAFQAFNCAALDYILKPVDQGSLATAVQRAKERMHQKNSSRRLEALLANIDASSNADKHIGIPNDHGIEFITAGDIICCQGSDGYTLIHLADGTRRTSSYPIGHYKKMLPTPDFFMTHRSFIVNRKHVVRLSADEISLNGGLKAEISRRRKKLVEDWLS
ncbi:response regulator transcription factor [Neolewinella aurantiaca]|uniref:Response regulator transcription factor n=1 Tax=Neolewinella aurantiaca TaxID=2602767 RepID=A0A5C7FIP4_9BACT|nr:LytTR family DNA-binding domain-containing protein [Neolewinella aurantiaca]TXF89671.1 response regulator transcription factor [Neolewinella aurantiaca]